MARALRFFVDRERGFLFVEHLKPWRPKADESDAWRHQDPVWGYMVPLRTLDDGLLALCTTWTYTLGKCYECPTALPQDVASPSWPRRLAWLIGAPSLTLAGHLAEVLAVVLTLGSMIFSFMRAVAARRLVGPFSQALGHDYASTLLSWLLGREDSVRERLRRLRLAELERERADHRRQLNAGHQSFDLEPAPRTFIPPPTSEELAALSALVEKAAGEPNVPGEVRERVLGDVEHARREPNPRRAQRMLQHAMNAVTTARSGG